MSTVSLQDSTGDRIDERANLARTGGRRPLNPTLVGYQHQEAEFKDGHLDLNYTSHGPMVGLHCRFLAGGNS
jgi:hypothetical protein